MMNTKELTAEEVVKAREEAEKEFTSEIEKLQTEKIKKNTIHEKIIE